MKIDRNLEKKAGDLFHVQESPADNQNMKHVLVLGIKL